MVFFVVEALVSASLQVLLDRASPRTNLIKFFQRHKFDEIHFKNLETTLLQVNAVLSDAEEKQITNLSVRQWIDELKDAAYHTVDLLDEIHSNSQESNSSDLGKTVKKHKSKLEKMSNKLENIAKHKDVLGLEASFSGKISPRLQQTSLVDETEVYGRGTDKKEIMGFLLSGSLGGKEIPVAAIIGIAGVGKTTLAQLLYNDPDVKEYFDKRAWVYISEDFDVFKVTTTLYESITSETCNIKDLNRLQVQLKEILTRAKFLIVLDDVWNEYYNKWDALRNFLKVGASDSRIIVTTRSQGVASTMRASHTYHLQPLNDDACLSVFENHAFRSTQAYATPKLKSIGREIVNKCRGLPLAAKVLGSLLYSKVDAHEWENILNCNIWDLPSDKSDVLPSLRLSYIYLSSHLKQCFAYCSIFPKGYEFDKDKLILLWMAEGFLLQPRSDKTMEEVGIECFHELLSRSFFQQVGGDNKPRFRMHDLINDLAQFASGESCFKLGKTRIISKKARHFSYVRDHFDDGPEIFDALKEAKFLWTFLPLSLSIPVRSCSIQMTVVDEYLPEQKRLRVLSLSHFVNINKLPDKFENLLHLRYLDLSHTAIQELTPVGKLYNLQTILLTQCIQLNRLPDNMSNLINLRHLDLKGTSALKMMPPKFGMLESLRILTTFVVSLGGSSIKELGRLSHLGGKLSILELQNVEDPKDAEDADLKNKKNINELEFSWSSTGRANVGDPKDAEDADLKNKKNIKEPEFSWSSTGHADEELGITWSSTGLADKERSQTTILEKLHPHENIEKLSIRGFRGTELPNWLGDSKFSNMVFLHLSDCRNCSSLPSLRQLSSLQKLRVMNCDCLMKFAINFSSHLKSLEIHDCGNLRILKISDNLHQDLKFFKKLEISKCPSLEMFRLPAPKLTDFSVSSCNNLRSMPKQMCQLLTSLQTLNISDCPRLVSFPNGGLPLSLQTLTIQNCVKLQSMPEQMHILPALQTLDISDCPELVPFPEGGLPSSLQKLTIQNCVKLRSMPEQVHMLLSSLQTLNITGCPELVSFPDGGLPPSLQTLTIKNCVNLISPPQNAWGLTNMESLTCLTIECAHANVNSFPDKGLLPASLTCLQIIGFPGLITLNLSGLQHLTLLKSLEIHSCNRLQILSDDGRLPSSLSSLAITGCSLQLKDQCQKDGGRYWDKISHIETRSITATI